MSNVKRPGKQCKMKQETPMDIEGCLRGEAAAWACLVECYGRYIRKAVFWTLRYSRKNYPVSSRGQAFSRSDSSGNWEKFADPAEVEDVVQEVYYRLVRGDYKLLKTYDPEKSSFGTWVCIVARSAAVDHLRNRGNGCHASLDEAGEPGFLVEWAEPVCSIPSGLLTPRQMNVVRLSYEKELEVEEIAGLLGVHPNTVRSLRHSALVRLREYHRTALASA